MNPPYWGNIDSRRLTRAYVALAFAQDVAKGYVNEHASAHPILTALEMSAKLLEGILEDVLPEDDLIEKENADYTELTMQSAFISREFAAWLTCPCRSCRPYRPALRDYPFHPREFPRPSLQSSASSRRSRLRSEAQCV